MAVGTTLNITIFCQLLAIVIVARCCASALRGGAGLFQSRVEKSKERAIAT